MHKQCTKPSIFIHFANIVCYLLKKSNIFAAQIIIIDIKLHYLLKNSCL